MAASVVVLLPVLLLLLVAPVLLVVLAVTARPDAALLPATAAARRHAIVGGVLAVVSAVAVLLLLARGGLPGLAADRSATLAPAGAALAHTAVLALTEVTWPRPTGTVRRVRLTPRTVAGTAPRLLRRALHVAVGLVTLTVLAGWRLADESQRAVSWAGETEQGYVTSTSSPFPGLVYGVPALAGVLLTLLAAEATLRLVVARPAVASADEATDAALRRAGAHRVLRGALAGVLLTLGGLLLAGGMTAANAVEGPLRPLALVAVAVGGVCALAGVLALLVWAPRVPAPAAEAPAGRQGLPA